MPQHGCNAAKDGLKQQKENNITKVIIKSIL